MTRPTDFIVFILFGVGKDETVMKHKEILIFKCKILIVHPEMYSYFCYGKCIYNKYRL